MDGLPLPDLLLLLLLGKPHIPHTSLCFSHPAPTSFDLELLGIPDQPLVSAPPPNPRDADHSLSIRVSRLTRAPDGFRRRGLSRRERQKAALGPPADVCVRGVLFHRSRRRYVWRNIAVFLWSCGTWSPSLRMFHCFI